MSTTAVERPLPRGTTDTRRRRVMGVGALVVILVIAGAVSLAVGARALSPTDVWHGLFGAPDPD
ncbi:iron ABC transporter permease, partial [Streptomyces niveus]